VVFSCRTPRSSFIKSAVSQHLAKDLIGRTPEAHLPALLMRFSDDFGQL
jgi:hypothetical protein